MPCPNTDLQCPLSGLEDKKNTPPLVGVVPTFNPCTQEAEEGEYLGV